MIQIEIKITSDDLTSLQDIGPILTICDSLREQNGVVGVKTKLLAEDVTAIQILDISNN